MTVKAGRLLIRTRIWRKAPIFVPTTIGYPAMRIYLIGFMGSGKSTIGRRLAKRLAYPFYDLDSVLEEKLGMSIREVFNERGEACFRTEEQKVLHQISKEGRGVIATGGGTPCFFDNMAHMNKTGVTVYLKMSPLSLSHRLENARLKRPLMEGKQGAELLASIRELLMEREPYYLQASCIIKGENAKPEQIMALIFGH